MSKARAILSVVAVSACLLAAGAIAADERRGEREGVGDDNHYHDEGHVYVDNPVDDPKIQLAISNSLKDEDTSVVSPESLYVTKGQKGTIAYGVRKNAKHCTDNNLDVAICAAPNPTSGSPNCDHNLPKCASGEITSECYLGTAYVEYCYDEIICDNLNCHLGNLPGGFSFKQGGTGKNHITFKISRN